MGLWGWEVQVFNETRDLQHKFSVRRGEWDWSRVALSSSKVLVLVDDVVDVHEHVHVHELDIIGGGITVTMEGHIAVTFTDRHYNGKVIVV